MRVPWLQVRGQEGGAGQVRERAPADSGSVLAPIVARQERLQRGPAPYPNERGGFETKASDSNVCLQPSDHVTWVVREQEVGLHLETRPQARVESLVAPPPRSHAAVTQIYRHHCDTTDAAREGMTSQERAREGIASQERARVPETI